MLEVIALAGLLMIGKVKAIPGLMDFMPIDPTLLLAMLLYAVIAVRIRRIELYPPALYFLYVPIILCMLASLLYTPLFAAGLDKTGRFIVLTGVAILAPFFVLTSITRLRAFIYALIVFGFVLSVLSLAAYEGEGRLTIPGGIEIGLGVAAATSLILIIYMVAQSKSILMKLVLLASALPLFVAQISTGARSALISLVLSGALAVFLHRRLSFVYIAFGAMLVGSLAFVSVPEVAYQYLSSLVENDVDSLMSWRGELMDLGSSLTVQHPITGVGIGGFAFYSKVPESEGLLTNWPHNVILEISSELGILSAVLMCTIILLSVFEVARCLRSPDPIARPFAGAIAGLMTIGLLTFMNTGDINDNRPMFVYLGLPFVLRRLSILEETIQQEREAAPSSKRQVADRGTVLSGVAAQSRGN